MCTRYQGYTIQGLLETPGWQVEALVKHAEKADRAARKGKKGG